MVKVPKEVKVCECRLFGKIERISSSEKGTLIVFRIEGLLAATGVFDFIGSSVRVEVYEVQSKLFETPAVNAKEGGNNGS